MHAAIASLQDTAYQDYVRARNREGRDMLTTALKGMGKRVAPSQTNFVFFQTKLPVDKVQASMKAKGYIIGRAFPPYNDWARVSIGTPEEMKAFVATLPETLRV